jgi:uncharacterized protein YfkK (UPF0435 family)
MSTSTPLPSQENFKRIEYLMGALAARPDQENLDRLLAELRAHLDVVKERLLNHEEKSRTESLAMVYRADLESLTALEARYLTGAIGLTINRPEWETLGRPSSIDISIRQSS